MSVVKRVISSFRFDRRICNRNFCVVRISIEELSSYVSCVPIVISRELVGIRNSCVNGDMCVNKRFHSFGERRRGGGELILSIFTERLRMLSDSCSRSTTGRVFLSNCVYGRTVCEGAPLKQRVTSLLITIGHSCNGSSCVPYVY